MFGRLTLPKSNTHWDDTIICQCGEGGEGDGTPLQSSCLESPGTGGAGRLRSMGSLGVRHDWATSLSLFYIGEGTGTHSRTPAWKTPWTEGPGGLQSMGSLRVKHDWATSLSLFTFMHWRRRWQPIPAFLPGGSQGLRSLTGCRSWGLTKSGTTEAT